MILFNLSCRHVSFRTDQVGSGGSSDELNVMFEQIRLILEEDQLLHPQCEAQHSAPLISVTVTVLFLLSWSGLGGAAA